MHIKYEAQVEGLFRLTTRKAATGEISQDTGWFKNLITNSGLDRLAAGAVIDGVAVGRGTNPELPEDTVLQIQVAKTNTLQSGSNSAQIGSNVPPYYAKMYKVYRFAIGTVTGNINEVGATWNYGNSTLFSRTLIRDTDGNPVTITVLADEILDVAYECRVYPQDTPTTGSVNLMGNTHTYKVVPLDIASVAPAQILAGALGFGGGSSEYYATATISAAPYAIVGGARTGFGTAPVVDTPYVPGSFKKFMRSVFAPGAGVGPIKTFNITSGTPFSSSFQIAIEFTPAFTKAATVELKIIYEITWARRAP